MDSETSVEYCRKCGLEIYQFSKKYSVSTGEYYCVKCAEKVDREYLIKNTCAMCKRLMKPGETKIAMPSKAFSEDTSLILADRVICTACYKKFSTASRMKMRTSGLSRIREQIRKSIARRSMQQQTQPQEFRVS